MIQRPEYMRILRQWMGNDQVKVLVGVRRCGKSTVLQMFADELESSGVPRSNIIQRRFDEFSVPIGFTGEDLRQDLSRAFDRANEGPVYIFLDEIQDVPDWELVVRRLHTRANTDVYITGSNAGLLSGELATYLTGRYVEIPVFPLSFAEYASYRQPKAAGLDAALRRAVMDELLREYMLYGGMPSIHAYGELNEAHWREALSAIYDSVVVRDVASRFSVRDLDLLRNVARYAFSTSGNLINPNKVSNQLKARGIQVSPRTVSSWLDGLQEAFVLYSAHIERVRGAELLSPLRKMYAVDNGFRNLACEDPFSDRGQQLEGAVFIELLRRGYQVDVGRLGSKEIDFVANRGVERVYLQVTWSMADQATRERELAPLQELTDAFPRYVITMDRSDTGVGVTADGIRVVHAVDWLLETR